MSKLQTMLDTLGEPKGRQSGIGEVRGGSQGQQGIRTTSANKRDSSKGLKRCRREPCRDPRKTVSDRGKGRCQGPEAGARTGVGGAGRSPMWLEEAAGGD